MLVRMVSIVMFISARPIIPLVESNRVQIWHPTPPLFPLFSINPLFGLFCLENPLFPLFFTETGHIHENIC